MFGDHALNERRLAAVALTRDGAPLAYERTHRSDFIEPSAWRVIEAAATAPDDLHGDLRLEHIATTAGVPHRYIEECDALPRICMSDLRGHYARIVREQAEQRRQAVDALDRLQELTGRRWEAA